MRDARGEVRAVVRASISLRTLSEKLLDVQPGVNGHMALHDLDSRILLSHADPTRILRPVQGDNTATERLYLGQRGAIESVSRSGERMLAAFTPVRGLAGA